MKVYVCTEAKLFDSETYVAVKSSKKKAESFFREKYPHMRKTDNVFPPHVAAYYSQKDINAPEARLLFIREEELD